MVRDNLIFGCSTITRQSTLKESLRLLGEASELGIAHFDTARAYGAGESEAILGRHLRGRRDEVIVTTKYGLAPPIANERVARAYSRATTTAGLNYPIRALRQVRKALRPTLFSPRKIRTNLEVSLRALGTDYVDYFLLHEAPVSEARRATVTRTLDQLVSEGKIRQYGIGSAYYKIASAETLIPASYRVLQFEHSPVAKAGLEVKRRSDRLIFTHSALSVLDRIKESLERHPALVRAARHALDVDVCNPQVLPGLLLVYSHSKNTAGKVIFSTRSGRRLVDNVTKFSEICGWSTDRLLGLQQLFDQLSTNAVS